MKIREFTKELLKDTKYSFKRFPITLFISVLLVVLIIIMNEDLVENTELFTKLSMITGLALPVSILIQLANESYFKNRASKISAYFAGGVFLTLYFIFFLTSLNTVDIARYIGTVVFFVFTCIYIQRFKNKYNYEKYIITILYGGLITGIYSLVLYLGTVFIIFTLQQLFDIRMISSIYFYIFISVVFIFGVSMFLSKYPNEDFKDGDYPKAFKLLLMYIVIPLISIYTLILYAYFLKIIITWQWPRGLVSHLVIWYSTISVFVIFFIAPILEENKLALSFRKYFPLINIPILVMMFLSIGQRIVQYGFTENRYYILLLGIWILLIMTHFILRRPKSSTFIMVSLSAFILISIFGPLSSFNVSIRSQNHRLNELLEKYYILDNGGLTPNNSVPPKDQQEISNVLSYFNYNHDLSYVKSLPDGYNLNNMVSDFGFPFSPGYQDNNYTFYYYHEWKEPVNVSNYDYYMSINPWNNRFSVSDLEVNFDSNNFILSIAGENNDFNLDIKDYAKFIHEEIKYKHGYDSEDMTIIIESDYKIKLIFNHIGGTEVLNDDDIDLHDVEFILLLDYNK